ncbi:hypothetical protein J6590_081152 [Homalodisca vitripennis]|nr:hypothetical protein J6590_081152 [Homalodisca vitripennis]
MKVLFKDYFFLMDEEEIFDLLFTISDEQAIDSDEGGDSDAEDVSPRTAPSTSTASRSALLTPNSSFGSCTSATHALDSSIDSHTVPSTIDSSIHRSEQSIRSNTFIEVNPVLSAADTFMCKSSCSGVQKESHVRKRNIQSQKYTYKEESESSSFDDTDEDPTFVCDNDEPSAKKLKKRTGFHFLLLVKQSLKMKLQHSNQLCIVKYQITPTLV